MFIILRIKSIGVQETVRCLRDAARHSILFEISVVNALILLNKVGDQLTMSWRVGRKVRQPLDIAEVAKIIFATRASGSEFVAGLQSQMNARQNLAKVGWIRAGGDLEMLRRLT